MTSRRTRVRLLLAAAILASGVTAATANAASSGSTSSTNGPVMHRAITIVASDGVQLAGDVSLPHAKGRFPAIVDMEPYGRSSMTTYLANGYAHVNTDIRGSGKSGGALCLLCKREQDDVYDVVEWVAHQPWSNGKVVLYGYSYSAITALLGAAERPPNLTAVIVGHPPTDPYRDVVWQNGMYNQGFVYQWFAGQTGTQAVGLGVQKQYLDRAQQEFAVETRLAPLDGPLYKERSVLAKMKRITVPVYIFTGWEDMYSRGDLRLIDGLASKHKLLYIDASTHHGVGEAGEIGAPYASSPADIGNAALNSEPPAGEVLRFLNRWVKGRHDGIMKTPRVRWLDLGNRTWHHSKSWRAAQTGLKQLYLSAKVSGSAVLSPNDGSLATKVPTGGASYQDAYVYNPATGASVPIDKEGPDGFLPYAPMDQRLDEPNGLTYTLPVLKKPLHLVGPAEFRFWAITEGSDMDWVARLEDVAPNGSARLITQGWLRASFRQVDAKRSRPGSPYLPDTRQEPVTIGLATKYRMDIWDTAWTLKKGHRLRLWLSSSDSPNHEPLPVAGRNLLLHSKDYPSRLILNIRR